MMAVHCAKCGCLIAKIEKPSSTKPGSKLTGLCYECQNRNMAQGKKPFEPEDIMKEFEKIFGKL